MRKHGWGAVSRSLSRGWVVSAIVLLAGTRTAIGAVIVPVGDNFVVVGADIPVFESSLTTDADVTSFSLMEDATVSIPQLDPATIGGRRLVSVTLTLVSAYGLEGVSQIFDTGIVSASTSVSLGDMEMAVLLNGQPLFSKLDDTGGTDSCTTSPSAAFPFPDSCTAEAAGGGDFTEQVVMGPHAPFVGNGAFDVTFEMSAGVSRELSPFIPLTGNFFGGEAIWNGDLFVSYELPEPGSLGLVLLGVGAVAMSRRHRQR